MTQRNHQQDLSFYNILRDLGDMRPDDVPPAFVEKFSANSDGKYDEAAAAQAACDLAKAAQANDLSGFQDLLNAGGDITEWSRIMTLVLDDSIQSQAVAVELSEDDLKAVAGGRGKIQQIDKKSMWAALQFNWG